MGLEKSNMLAGRPVQAFPRRYNRALSHKEAEMVNALEENT
jgi:hypothetical protein